MRTRTTIALTSILSAIAAPAALADMTGYVYQHVRQVSAVDGFGAPDFNGTVIDLWMEFDDADDILLNVFNFNDVNLDMLCYYHSSSGQTWRAYNLGAPFETDALKYADSYVSIGGDGGSQPGPDGTPKDSDENLCNAPDGWYNSDPGAPMGAVVSTSHTSTGMGVFIGRFSFNGETLSMEGGTGGAMWNQGIGTEVHQADFVIVPTPGALALLGLAGLAGRRRRN